MSLALTHLLEQVTVSELCKLFITEKTDFQERKRAFYSQTFSMMTDKNRFIKNKLAS